MFSSPASLLPVVALLTLQPTLSQDLVSGAFFSIGHGSLIRTRLDPIVNPEEVSGHVHSVIGSSAFTANMDFTSAREGDCTTSFIQADMSGYWVPQLMYKYRNGTYYAIQGDGLIAYWKYAFADPSEKFHVVPDDFRMLAGDVKRDTYDESNPSHAAISFECVGDGFDYKFPYIPADLECPTIRPQAFFPSCWNGKDSFLPNNAHVTYPLERYEGGPCPDGYVRIPSLFVEGYYKVKDNVPDYEWYPGCLVLANGDTNGYSFHADWLNGWPSGMLVDAYDKCARAGKLRGSVDGCEVFEASRDQDKAFHCEAKGQTVAEAIGLNVPLAALPGNNPEFNSSKLAANHDKATMGTARILSAPEIVTIPADGSGSCVTVGGGKVCSDYAGGGQVANVVEDTGMDGLPPSFTVSNGAMVATSTSMGMGMGMVQSPSPSPSPMMNGTNVNLMANDDVQSAPTVTVTVTATASASECVCSPHMRRSRIQRGQ